MCYMIALAFARSVNYNCEGMQQIEVYFYNHKSSLKGYIVQANDQKYSPSNCNQRYLKKSRLLKFCYVSNTNTISSKGICALAINSTIDI